MAELDEEGPLRQGRRQAARGFHRHDRPLRRPDRLRQSALPVAAALFHRLSGGDETERRLEDRLEILPLRSARVIATQAIGGREPLLLRPMLYGPCIVAA